MTGRCALPLLVALAFAAQSNAQPSADATTDEKLLQSAHLKTDGSALIDYFRKRAAGKVDGARISKLARDLNDVETVEQAMAELVSIGPAAAPQLRDLLAKKPNNEAEARIKKCLSWVEGPGRHALPAAALRLLAIRQPSGAVKALLAYAPAAEADGVSSELRDSLIALATRDGKIDPALRSALTNAAAQRRMVAAEALLQVGGWDSVADVRRLLDDADPAVRLRIALGLLELRDGAAIPILVALVEQPTQRRQAEEALTQLAGAFAPKMASGADEASRKKARAVWTAWWNESDGRSLLDYFQRRTLHDEKKVVALFRALGHASYPIREKAAAELVALRGLAVPVLRSGLRDGDLEIQRRCRICLERIGIAVEAPRTLVNVRLLVLRQPADAAELLLDFLPFAEDDTVEAEIRNVLINLAKRDASKLKRLAGRLEDKSWQRRGGAAEALAVRDHPTYRKLVRERLRDVEPMVRLRTATALVMQQDRDAVPVLIDLLTELPLNQAREAEDILQRLAAELAPRAQLSDEPGARQKSRAAWADWWKLHADRTDLARLRHTSRLLGYTIVARWNYRDNVNEIVELGLNQEVRWKIEGLGYSFDFQLLPNNRLLIAENNKNRITERNFKGDILWEYSINQPHNVQRLPSGNTFIATGSELVEVDRQSAVVFRISHGNMSACKLSDGRILAVSSNGQCTWFDTKGAKLKTLQITGAVNSYGCLEALPRGGALLCLYNDNRVVEFDADGKVQWEVKRPNPFMAVRLPNGNTLITSQSDKSAVEVNSIGDMMWSHRPEMGIWRGRRR